MSEQEHDLTPDGLREKDELLRLLTETSRDLIGVLDLDGRIVYASSAAEILLGRTPNSVFERMHPDDLENGRRWWAQVLAGSHEIFTWRISTAAGDWRWRETWCERVQYHGKPHILAFCRDVTDAKQAEVEREKTLRRLSESLTKLAEAEEIAHVGYWENDLEADRITWSDETYRILGMDPGERRATAAQFRDVIHPEDRQIQAEASARAKRGEGRYDAEYRVVRPNGEIRTIHSVGNTTFDESGRPVRGFGVVQDITERKETERALSESHALLKAIVDGTSDAIFVKDLAGRYLMINAAGMQSIGMSEEEVLGKDDRELFGTEAAGPVMEHDRRVMESGESQTFEEELSMEGVTKTWLATKGVYRDANGQVIGLVGISSDITEMKRLMDQFRQAQKMEAVGRLAGGVAHDFNNLLTVINSYSDMILQNLSADDPNRELVTEIRFAGDRGAGLTRQLLAFSRNQVLQPQVVNLNTLLKELKKLLRRLIAEDVELAVRSERALGFVKVDPGQFEQAIINLAINARDAMPSGGRLTLETHNMELTGEYTARLQDVRPGSYVMITVSDSGSGMDKATIARIFDPFFTTKERGKGTGLGLAMVYGFVKQSGGHIEVESEMGCGSKFRIYVPRITESAEVARSPRDVKMPIGIETVLLVEDEEPVRTLLRRVLESSGYTVLSARDGADAVRIAREYAGDIQILVTDLVMPKMNGRQLAEQLLATSRPELSVLFMSGYTDEILPREGIQESRVAFLQKPFNPIELAHKIREVLEPAVPLTQRNES